ncbi:hypothetical protein [Actinoplanes sp. NPDC023714]|uniref:hypothetical protein n=1 Tax=Actinoplanes sp. NPDC023714 TaxID=3154322 RepID=UPI0033E7D97F
MRLNMFVPSMLPACSLPVSAAPTVLLTAERPVAPWAHQAQIQAELGKAVLVLDGNKGTTGFSGNGSIARKRYTDGGGGIPPRGRPV